MQLDYAVMEKERARHALMQMHEHLSRQFPEACPMDLDAPPVQPETRRSPADRGHRQERSDGRAGPRVQAVPELAAIAGPPSVLPSLRS